MRVFNLDISDNNEINNIISSIESSKSQLEVALMRALNKTALWVKSQSVKEIAKEKLLKQKIIRNRLQVLKANRKQLIARVLASLHGVKANQIGNVRQTKTGAKAGKRHFKGAFVATMPTGHTGIYKRKSRRKLPIREVVFPLEPIASTIIKEITDEKAAQQFTKLFAHEIKFATKRQA